MDQADVEQADTEATTMTRRQRLTIVATGLGMFIVMLDALIVNVALPEIQTEFDVGESGAQAVATAYSVGMAMTIMWSATLADLRGRRRVYLGAVIVFVIASTSCGIAPNFGILVAGRAIQGLAAGPITVASLALLSAAFTDDRARTRAIGFWSGLGSSGAALGPTIGGVLVEELGWRSVFFVNIPIGLVAVVLTLVAVDESSDPSERTFDYGGQLLFGSSIVSFSAALIVAPQMGWLSFTVIGLFAVSALSIVGFSRRERACDDPMMDLDLFSNGVYRLSLITLFVVFFVGYGLLLIVTQYLQNVRDYSAIEAGLLMLPFPGGVVTVSTIAGHIVGRFGSRRTVVTSLALLAAGVASVMIGLSLGLVIVGMGMLLLGFGFGLALVPLTAVSIASVPSDKSGMASGVMSTQRAIGSTAGYALLGSILALWVGNHIGDKLAPIVADPSQLDQISSLIIEQANPSAFTAELGPAQPISISDAAEASQILDAADEVFVTGMQISLGVGLLVAMVLLVVVARTFPDTATTSTATSTSASPGS